MPVIAGLAIALSAAASNGVGLDTSTQAALVQTMPATQSVEDYVREYFADVPVMIDIARCESRFRQFGKDGHALKNPNSSATGAFQIMASIHAKYADEKLGYDIYSLEGNAAYARYLYEREGTIPWAASSHCWNKSGKLLARAK